MAARVQDSRKVYSFFLLKTKSMLIMIPALGIETIRY